MFSGDFEAFVVRDTRFVFFLKHFSCTFLRHFCFGQCKITKSVTSYVSVSQERLRTNHLIPLEQL